MLPTIANKFLDTIIHSFISSIHALPERYDIALYFIAGNSPVTWIPRLVGTKSILNVDGLDWKREKWPTLAKKYIQFAEYLATKLPTVFVTDSQVVQNYYLDRFNSVSSCIPYGSDIELVPAGETLKQYDLQSGKYILFVGRLVPENCVHHLVDAYRELDSDLKCVIVGDAAYSQEYISKLKEQANGDDRIIFTGYVFGKGYHELGSNASIFVESSGVGGTHPALVEAMAFGNCVVVHNTPENLETIGDAGFAYDGKQGAEALKGVLQSLLEDPDLVARYGLLAQQRAKKHYDWDAVTGEYEQLFKETIALH
jgi:glycosyltransferase involved in cell wall biosynthesis